MLIRDGGENISGETGADRGRLKRGSIWIHKWGTQEHDATYMYMMITEAGGGGGGTHTLLNP